MNTKKIITGVISIIFLFGGMTSTLSNKLFCNTIYANAENPANDFELEITESDTIKIKKYKGTSSKVKVPSTLLARSVTEISDGAFKGNDAVTEITVPDSVTVIGSEAFCSCPKLKKLVLSKNCTSIGDSFAKSCEALEDVRLPENVDKTLNGSYVQIAASSFENCSSLKKISIPTSIHNIGSGAFRNCTSLKEVSVGSYISKIEYEAFYNCTSLEKINLPEGLNIIEAGAFTGCSALNKVILPGSLIEMRSDDGVDGPFANCTSLESITIPKSLKIICNGCFINCISLNEVIFSGEGTEEIEGGAFINCPSLKEITLPRSLTKIGGYRDTGLFFDYSSYSDPTLKTDFILHCYKGSEAEKYAIKCGMYNIDYIEEKQEDKEDNKIEEYDIDKIIPGDVNFDGGINVTDIAVTAAHIKGIKALTEVQQKASDVNNDNQINVTDIAIIASHIKGIKAIGSNEHNLESKNNNQSDKKTDEIKLGTGIIDKIAKENDKLNKDIYNNEVSISQMYNEMNNDINNFLGKYVGSGIKTKAKLQIINHNYIILHDPGNDNAYINVSSYDGVSLDNYSDGDVVTVYGYVNDAHAGGAIKFVVQYIEEAPGGSEKTSYDVTVDDYYQYLFGEWYCAELREVYDFYDIGNAMRYYVSGDELYYDKDFTYRLDGKDLYMNINVGTTTCYQITFDGTNIIYATEMSQGVSGLTYKWERIS